MTQALVSKNDVQRAKLELDRMRRSLQGWLKYRTLNDAVAAGAAPTTKSRAYAAEVVTQSRDWAAEQRLAKQIYVLLSETMPGVQLPDPNVATNPQAAVQLAQIAISGATPGPSAQGALPMMAIIIVGGLLLAVTTVVRSYADVAKEKERLACVRAGACTDHGFWLKAGGITALVYVAWKMGLGERIGKALKG
jgi:hypothetical protein